MSEAKRTPDDTEHLYLPYCSVPYGPNEFHIVDGGGDTVAVTKPVYGYPGHDEKIAAHICRAVNSHDALVEACNELIKYTDHSSGCKSEQGSKRWDETRCDCHVVKARAALALAEGGAK